MKLKNLFIPGLLLAIYIPSILFAYSNSIKGKVLNGKTDQQLPGSNIFILGTDLGAAADEFGEFVIKNIPPGKYILKVTHIGYKSIQKNINISYNKTITLKILLEQTVIKGQSVIITANVNANQAIERESPIAFVVMGKKELANNYTTGDLPELIENVPDVWTSSAGLGETEIKIRGFASDKINFLINEIPMNDPEGQGIYWSNWAGLSNAVGSIAIHRGSGFSLNSSNAFGGSVHIETMGVTSESIKTFRFSTGVFNRMGIQSGANSGKIIDPLSNTMETINYPRNYTYSARFNSGPQYNGKLNLSLFFEYKKGDSYILGTGYDGFTIGLEAKSELRKHTLFFNFFVSPQAHGQAFALQDIDLLKTIGREFNRKNHEWQENYYTKPFWSLKHEWQLSENKILVNNIFFTLGKGADQTCVNDVFDVESGTLDFQPCTRGMDAQSFGYHAQYLYNNYGLQTTDFIPAVGDFPSWFNPNNAIKIKK